MVVHDSVVIVIEENILQDTSEFEGSVDLRLLLFRQANAFGVATSFDVENTIRSPTVLIITNESSLGVG